jgi:uncharacterized protein YsxB (DUF464 family)
MLHVTIYRDKKKKIRSYEASGHCGFEEEGKDIVCSGASTLLQVSILGIDKYCNIKPEVNISRGNLTCKIPELKDNLVGRDIQTILETMFIGLTEIEKQYPEYLKVNLIQD